MLGRLNLGHSGGSGGSGVAPMNVKNIRVKEKNQKVIISWQDPEDTYDDDGNLLCTWKGTKVVQKAGAYPTSPVDGTIVVDNQVRNAYKDNGFEINGLTNEVVYYYSLFPYSEDGVTNKNEVNRITAKPTATKTYGIRRLISSTSSAWERLDSAEGLVANATKNGGTVQNDFDSLYPWSDIISYNYDTVTQEIKAYYGDATFKWDGTNGDVLTRIPEFWYKRYQEDGYEYIYIADGELDGYTKSNEFSLGRYTISGNSSKVSSKSGVAPLCSTTITDFRNYAKKLGTGFGIMDWRYFLIQLLYLVEYADYNSQSMLGQGNVSSGSIKNSGGCNALGMKSGCLGNNGSYQVIYRGLEDIFGNIFQFVDGLNISSYKAYICYDPTKYAVDTFSGNYQEVGYTNCSSDGYASKLGYSSSNPLISLPTEVAGSSSTGTCDRYYQNSGNRIVRVGGYYNDYDNAGLWCWYCYSTSSSTYSYLGARLLKYQ